MNNDTIIWCSDLSQSSGEGILARKFLDQFFLYKKNYLIKVKTFNHKIFIKKKIIYKNIKSSNNFFHRYICIFFGAFYLLFNYKKKRLVYVNYLPLWNFLLFLILPKKTILGPITGGIYNGKVEGINSFIRKYIFPLFCKISLIVINRKFNNIIFSTRLLESYYKKINNNRTNILYDFIFIFLKKKKIKKKKKYDVIFYNRNHFTKKSKNFSTLINILSKKFTICVVGDYYKNNKIINFGRVSRKKIHSLLLESKFAFNGAENIFSLFAIDAINCGVKVFYNEKIKVTYKNNSNYLIPINFNDLLSNFEFITSLLKKNLKIQDKKFNLFVVSQKKRIANYLSEYFY
jgi:hypothetical protein